MRKVLVLSLFCAVAMGVAAIIPEPLSGTFSVAVDKQVRFAAGNLQYTFSAEEGGKGTWAFAVQQYDFIGTDNVTGGTVFSGKDGDGKNGDALALTIDLFGWSGSEGTAEWGISTSTDGVDYSGEFRDWGRNIGDGTTWRTLTKDEWYYLLHSRPNVERGLIGVAKIDLGDGAYANGLVLLPDNWQAPADVPFMRSFTGVYGSSTAYDEFQTLTLSQWKVLESTGAVFLPAAGKRDGVNVSYVQAGGGYWSATLGGGCGYDAFHLFFDSTGAGENGYSNLSRGRAVRLVQDL